MDFIVRLSQKPVLGLPPHRSYNYCSGISEQDAKKMVDVILRCSWVCLY